MQHSMAPATFALPAITTRYGSGETIYRQGDRADYCYRLVCGAARQGRLAPNGKRHIVNFLLPGDLFGFGARGNHQFSVETLCAGTLVTRYPRITLESLADSDPMVGRQVREAAFDTVARLQTLMTLRSHGSALERVGLFLLQMTERCSSAPNVIVLPMSRFDIADYLAIAVETVSRAITSLRTSGVISVNGARRITIVDRSALERLAIPLSIQSGGYEHDAQKAGSVAMAGFFRPHQERPARQTS